MAEPILGSDHKYHLISILTAKLFAGSLSANDLGDLMMDLDREISRYGPEIAPIIEDAVFGRPLGTVAAIPIVEWYLNVMSGKPETWLTKVNPFRTMDGTNVPNMSVKAHVIKFTLLAELVQRFLVHQSAIVSWARKRSLYDDHTSQLTSEGLFVAQVLAEEILTDSDLRRRVQPTLSIEGFGLTIMRACFVDDQNNMPEFRRETLLNVFGSLGSSRRSRFSEKL